MTTTRRVNALHDALASLAPQWALANDMAYASQVPNEAAHRACLGLADLSHLPRWGVKGPGAAAALAATGLIVPEGPNRWAAAMARVPLAGTDWIPGPSR